MTAIAYTPRSHPARPAVRPYSTPRWATSANATGSAASETCAARTEPVRSAMARAAVATISAAHSPATTVSVAPRCFSHANAAWTPTNAKTPGREDEDVTEEVHDCGGF